ncbi:MAG: beta-mannosidase [Actinobacteria bacterium 69-20]|jgi:beta-mannosidase|nr:glycoside hydrolase family 2 protein [Actinomycetota bacterium]OJV30347.1 MAG: beta-mannosidase [Actinobacteria bacterium 69-20]
MTTFVATPITEPGPLLRRPVTDGWTVRVDPDGPTAVPAEARAVQGQVIPAAVPGAVHDDLQRAGLIADPFVDDGEDVAAWVSRTDWLFETRLPAVDVAPGERVSLVFDGLDTAARVVLGGVELGTSRNMHRSYRYDMTDLVRSDNRDLAVYLTSAYTEAESVRAAVGPRPNAYPEPFNFIRKMACSFGWDWGITLVGAGIWRPVRLETWSVARLSGLRAFADVDGGDGTLRLLLDIERAPGGVGAKLSVDVFLDEMSVATAALAPGDTTVELTVRVPNVRLWNPVGHGSSELYRLHVRLRRADGALLDSAERRVGFRHLRLERTPDPVGTSFTFRVNDVPLFVKGVNWIPPDILPGRMSRDHYAMLLRAAVDANVNLIRVWGGGVYESDDFYDLADELGLMVWQDFPFACAAYPENEPLLGEVRAEAEENVVRLASHPSLVLWNGNNECQWLRLAEDWASQPGGDKPWGERYYAEILPEIVARLDPSRPYTAGSPWSGSPTRYPNDPAHGTFHSWDVWNREDYARYRDTVPRFVSEFGWQAPPAWQTLRDAVSDNPLTPTSPGVLRHQKATGGMAKLRRGLAPHADVPDDFDAWHFLMQWNQVRAIETGVMHWRSHWPHTAGTILWQLNDLWPVISWSAIDGAGRPKPLYHALREMYAPRALTIQPYGAGLVLCALNDSPDPWVGEAVVRRVSDAGVDQARRILPIRVAPRSVARLPIPPEVTEFADPRSEVLVAELSGLRTLWYRREPKDTDFVGAPPRINARPVPGGLAVDVTATTLLRDFLIQPDRIHPHAVADRGFLTLLPGESATVTITCQEPLGPDAVDTPWAAAYLDAVIHPA